MAAYRKPSLYHTAVRSGSTGYKKDNGFVSGSLYYLPAWQGSNSGYQVEILTFGGAPANGSQLIVRPYPGAAPVTFTYTYSGSPGAGIIPLVGGGGTAAQAATATQVALAAQLLKWVVTNPSAGVVSMTYSQKGFSLPISTVGTVNFTYSETNVPSLFRLLPGAAGPVKALLSI